jgi:phenylalanyl-tRNA synthetase alpha chain
MTTDPAAQLDVLIPEGIAAFDAAQDLRSLEQARVAVLGRKAPLASLSASLGGLDPTARRELGQRVNAARQQLEAAYEARAALLQAAAQRVQLEADRIDVTLPGRGVPLGHPHPLRLVGDRIVDAFVAMGYRVAEGPEVEDDWHNFQALNIPPDHPARSMQDTLYLGGLDLLLRTHTSPVQIRTMLSQPPPVYVVVPGRAYRRDPFDATHSPCFHQVEGLAVDRGITFADLKGTLAAFARTVLGEHQRVRLRPSYFPFTEPSAEVDVLCVRCGGDGCSACGRSGWMEIMGAGLVHPNVLRAGGYDPDDVSGFAFGMGVERVAMAIHDVPDIRLFFENDRRFLAAFH